MLSEEREKTLKSHISVGIGNLSPHPQSQIQGISFQVNFFNYKFNIC